jgi:hypothetical protein
LGRPMRVTLPRPLRRRPPREAPHRQVRSCRGRQAPDHLARLPSQGLPMKQVIRRQPWGSMPSTWVTSRCQDKDSGARPSPASILVIREQRNLPLPKQVPKPFLFGERRSRQIGAPGRRSSPSPPARHKDYFIRRRPPLVRISLCSCPPLNCRPVATLSGSYFGGRGPRHYKRGRAASM